MLHRMVVVAIGGLALVSACDGPLEPSKPAKSKFSKQVTSAEDSVPVHFRVSSRNSSLGLATILADSSIWKVGCDGIEETVVTADLFDIPGWAENCIAKLVSFTVGNDTLSEQTGAGFSAWSVGSKAVFAAGKTYAEVEVISQISAALGESETVEYAFKLSKDQGILIANGNGISTTTAVGGADAPAITMKSAAVLSSTNISIKAECSAAISGNDMVNAKCGGDFIKAFKAVSVEYPQGTIDQTYLEQIFTNASSLATLNAALITQNDADYPNGGFSVALPASNGNYLVAVSNDSGDAFVYVQVSVSNTISSTSYTYTNDIYPIFEASCGGGNCHDSGSGGHGFHWDVYQNGSTGAYDVANAIYDRAVVQKNMPQAGALPATQQDIITAWFFAGSPE